MVYPGRTQAFETFSNGFETKKDHHVMKKLVSIIVPTFQEEENVQALYDALKPVFEACKDRYSFELVFTDNHSQDETWARIIQLSEKDDRVRAFRFSRNFGYQRSILTGYIKARGDAVIQLDCDLQDPPELIIQFLELWEEGHQVVYGVRVSRNESFWLNAFRKLFYRLANLLSEDELPVDAGDFRLVDRKVVAVLKNMEDAQPYLRGAIAAMGFNQVGVPYERASRVRGKSNFTLPHLFGLALDGILNHSVVPLRIATYTGILVSVGTLLALGLYVFAKVVFGAQWPPGFATTTTLILFSLSLNALFLGIIGEYLGRIYRQVKRQPLTVIENSIEEVVHHSGGENGDSREQVLEP